MPWQVDPATLGHWIEKVRGRFGLERIALVGDQGMTAGAQIREELAPAGLDRISTLKPADIRMLMNGSAAEARFRVARQPSPRAGARSAFELPGGDPAKMFPARSR